MSLSAQLFGRDSLIFKVTNVLGLGIPGLLDKTFGPGEQPGMALGEIAQQTAKEGEPRVIVWGRVRPIGGNLIHVQTPVKRWVKQKSSGGKGGGGSKSQKVEHVYRTYAVGVCEGPITGYARIWRNNKLVYDGRGTEWGEENNGIFLQSFRLYTGGWNQMPDPALEAIWGAGDVPAYRGTAYIVALDEDLTELGGSVPQWLFEVERAEGFVVTSRPYPYFLSEDIETAPAGLAGGRHYENAKYGIPAEKSSSGGAGIIGGSHRNTLIQYDALHDQLASVSATVTGGTHNSTIKKYAIPQEAVGSGGAEITGGDLRIGKVKYEDWEPESLGSIGSHIVGGHHGAD